jgi:hypothetical protein
MADLATQDAPFGLNQVTFTPGERLSDRLFEGEEAVLHVIERIVAPLGIRVSATSPWVDARLPDALGCRPDFLDPFLGCRLVAFRGTKRPIDPACSSNGAVLQVGGVWL